GGFVVCAAGGAERLDPPPGLEAVLVVPSRAVRTAKARAALPPEVPMGDAVFNIGRASLLVLGLARGDLDLVARGLADRLHQPRRASLYPRSMELVERAAEIGALGATISGAGPSVLVWVRAESAAAVAARLESQARGWAAVMRLPFSAAGVSVRTSGM
ncbi:MAG TPA: homoserine kinase, partial [Solirubrobacteraceae bacterium]|nr:homoserine kinase [Solirubrobacteraceae bacterium]